MKTIFPFLDPFPCSNAIGVLIQHWFFHLTTPDITTNHRQYERSKLFGRVLNEILGA
jgi:hypothetical protein